MVSSALLVVVKVVLLLLLLLTCVVDADYFTNPPSFTTQGTTYINVQTLDLSYNVTLGQTVQVTWYSPALDGAYISLTVAHWDTDGNATTPSLRSLISTCSLSKLCIFFCILIPNSKLAKPGILHVDCWRHRRHYLG